MINTRQAVTAGETPEKITISMITQDLKDGVNKAEMSIKYGIKPWEVDEMFKHPLLKGKRPARKRTLSFSFIDDVSEETPAFVEESIDPNQRTLEEVIAEAETEITGIPNGDTISDTDDDELEIPTLKDTMDLVEEQELEMNDETFEL